MAIDPMEFLRHWKDIFDDHFHGEQLVRPTLADPIALTSAAGAWNLSAAFTEIIANADIGEDFDIHGVDVSGPTANEDYVIVLYAIEVEIARLTFTRTGNFTSSIHVTVTTPIVPAGTQIQAKIADGAGANSAAIKVYLHTY